MKHGKNHVSEMFPGKQRHTCQKFQQGFKSLPSAHPDGVPLSAPVFAVQPMTVILPHHPLQTCHPRFSPQPLQHLLQPSTSPLQTHRVLPSAHQPLQTCHPGSPQPLQPLVQPSTPRITPADVSHSVSPPGSLRRPTAFPSRLLTSNNF